MRRIAMLAAAGLCLCACTPLAHATIEDDFAGPDGLITAEGQPPNGPWQVTSGTLFRQNDTGWTGVPDATNNSAVFRMVSLERDFGNVDMSLKLRVDDLVHTRRTPAQDYDGAHIWVGYQSQYELYAVSVDRRDNTMIIKKKCAGGTDNGGTYYDLTDFIPAVVPLGQWQQINVSVRDQDDGSVKVVASRDGQTMEAIDTGVGCAPLHGGAVGVRGDNAEIRLAHITVRST